VPTFPDCVTYADKEFPSRQVNSSNELRDAIRLIRSRLSSLTSSNLFRANPTYRYVNANIETTRLAAALLDANQGTIGELIAAEELKQAVWV